MRPNRLPFLAVVVFAGAHSIAARADTNWLRSTEFPEASVTTTIEDGVRVYVNAPLDATGEPARATRLIIYALPNGNTLEQTIGCRMTPGRDWHYDIQHVAAQLRLLRTLESRQRIVLVCAEAPGLSWPTFRKNADNANAKIGELVRKWRSQYGNDETKVTLTGHSGGGSFIWGAIEATDDIPHYIDRVAFLDANYSFDAALHAKKLEDWLTSDDSRRLIVVCYDDREIMLNGKKVVGPTGGTFRATGRMRDAFSKVFTLSDSSHDPFHETIGLNGRVHFYTHPNPENKILHTALVGEMNGLVHVNTLGTTNEGRWGAFGGPRAYTRFIQPEPTPAALRKVSSIADSGASAAARDEIERPDSPLTLPPRSIDAIGGAAFAKSIESLTLSEREAAILREITSGNIPAHLRHFVSVKIRGNVSSEPDSAEVTATIDVLPDYLAVGSDVDFVRMPMTPQTAQLLADRCGCTLPTRKIVDAIDAAASIRLAPRPLTQARESVSTFVEHNRIIEQQFGVQPRDLLVAGIKKDIVLSPRVFEKPSRLAIYGWRQLDGAPIQPLSIVHWNEYVDYSHGVRLIRDTLDLNGTKLKVADLLSDSDRCGLVSDEGPMRPPRYPGK